MKVLYNWICFLLSITFIYLFSSFTLNAQSLYYPPAGDNWEVRSAAGLGMDESLLDSAVQFAMDHENSVDRDLRIAILRAFSSEPYHQLAGPVKERGGPAGLIIKDGYIVADWGDLERVDMTFSVTKSYLSAVAGVAFDQKLIGSVNDSVANYVWDRTFDGEHNSAITWEHLLNQSSDWVGVLFDMEDWGDRPPSEGELDDWRMRELHPPGTHFKYNDVRVNLLAYSLLQVLRKPLPQVLKKQIMDPIGASTTWRWFGYDHSWVMVDGLNMQSVSGGGHNGGGLFINTYDQARFGLLYARRGYWKSQQLISEEWIDQSKFPSVPNPDYGYLWWTLKGNTAWNGVPDHVYYAAGFGGNYIVIDEVNDLVIVTRWLDNASLGEFVEIIYQSMLNQ
ncbi:MAG: serine hydrolase [Balneolaceae bacterium]